MPAKVTANGIEVRYFRRSIPRSRFAAPDLAHAVAERMGDVDVIHLTGLWTQPVAAAAAAACKAGVPYVISPRGMLMPWELRHKSWKKLPYLYARELPRLRHAAGIHCTSPAERQALTRFELDDLGFVVPNIVHAEEFEAMPDRGESRGLFNIPADALLVLFLGRLHAKKGINETLESFERLAAACDSAHLLVAGPDEGGYYERISRTVGPLGLGDRVHVAGALAGSARLASFAAADVFISLSESENFSMATAEAMAAGLPVVVSAGVGLSPWIDDSGAGVVAERDPDAVALVLQELLSRPDRRAVLGAHGREMVRKRFSSAAVGSAMLAAYERVVFEGQCRMSGKVVVN